MSDMYEHHEEFPAGKPAFIKPKGRPRLGDEETSRAFSEHLHRLVYRQGWSIKETANYHEMAYAPTQRRVKLIELDIRERRRMERDDRQ